MTDVYVLGAGMTRFGKHQEHSMKDLAREAIEGALRSAGVETAAGQPYALPHPDEPVPRPRRLQGRSGRRGGAVDDQHGQVGQAAEARPGNAAAPGHPHPPPRQ